MDMKILYAIILNISICFLLPIICIVYLLITKQKPLKPVLIGALVFVMSQILTRIPLLNLLNTMDWFKKISGNGWIYGIFLGLTAGIFEEAGRFIWYKTVLKDRVQWVDAVAFGVGHGGIEAILLVGVPNINNIILLNSINNGTFEQLTSSLPPETSKLIFTQLTETSHFVFALGGCERIFAFIIQIALSILVLYAVRERKNIFLFLAVLAHMIVDTPVVILSLVYGLDVFQIEFFVAGVAVLAYIYILFSQRLFEKN